MMRVPDMIVQHQVMSCPVCGQDIEADVLIRPSLGAPTIVEGRKHVEIEATATLHRFNVHHTCPGRIEGAKDKAERDEMMKALYEAKVKSESTSLDPDYLDGLSRQPRGFA